MRIVKKTYQRAFILEPTKLTRLVGVIHERLEDHPCDNQSDTFEVFLSDNSVELLRSLEEVLALENSKKHKIKRVLITSKSIQDGNDQDLVTLDFDSKAVDQNNKNMSSKISVVVQGQSASWANRTLSEIEEQLERTRREGLGPVGAALIVIATLIPTVVLLVTSLPNKRPGARGLPDSPETRLWLTDEDLDRVQEMLKRDPQLSDEQIREINTRQLRNLLDKERPLAEARVGITRRRVFLIAPLVIIAIAGVYLLVACYPSAVFLWGDEIERYRNVRQRRTVVWTVIIGATVMGILTNLFSAGLSSWLVQ
jgi:hypothetical protein